MVRFVPIVTLLIAFAAACGGSQGQEPAGRQSAGEAASEQRPADDGECEVVWQDQEIQDASGNAKTVQIPVCKGWEQSDGDQAAGEGGCKRIEWRRKLVPNYSGGAAGTVRVPVCIQ